MLKITVIETPTEQKLVLEGKLAKPDLAVLESAWERALGVLGKRCCIIDLTNMTAIDPQAEGILLDMKRHSAQFVACGVSTRHQLAQLGIPCK
jgi:hypothetical protein